VLDLPACDRLSWNHFRSAIIRATALEAHYRGCFHRLLVHPVFVAFSHFFS
jgi:hypothetical protein